MKYSSLINNKSNVLELTSIFFISKKLLKLYDHIVIYLSSAVIKTFLEI